MTDEYLMNKNKLNLSRYYQLLRVAGKAKLSKMQEMEEMVAWHGWMVASHEYQMKDKKAPSLKDWRKMMGVEAMSEMRGLATKDAPKVLDEAGKQELYEETMRFVAMDMERTASRARGSRKAPTPPVESS